MKIGFWGDVFIDVWQDVDRVAINPEAHTPTYYFSRPPRTYLGGAANAALQIRHFATPVLFGYADSVVEEMCKANGIELRTRTGRIPRKTRFVKDGRVLCRVDDDVRFEQVVPDLDGLDALVVSDYHKGTVPNSFRWDRSLLPVIVDCKRSRERWRNAVLKMNESDAASSGMRPDVITRGPRPPLLHFEETTVPPFRCQHPFEPSGAGDAFSAFLAFYLASGDWLEGSVRRAHLAAAAAGSTGHFRSPVLPSEIAGLTDPPARKLLSWDEFVLWLKHRAKGTLAVTCGCFDLLHAGHLRLLQRCRELADHVVVLLNSDESVRRLKGEGRPRQTAADRARILASLETVDQVQVFDYDAPSPFIWAMRRQRPINWFVKGSDWTDKRGSELADAIELVPVEGQHTSDLLR